MALHTVENDQDYVMRDELVAMLSRRNSEASLRKESCNAEDNNH